MSEEKAVKEIVIDQDACIGCGGCVSVAPEYFELNDEGKSTPTKKKYDESDKEAVDEAINTCPVQAIKI